MDTTIFYIMAGGIAFVLMWWLAIHVARRKKGGSAGLDKPWGDRMMRGMGAVLFTCMAIVGWHDLYLQRQDDLRRLAAKHVASVRLFWPERIAYNLFGRRGVGAVDLVLVFFPAGMAGWAWYHTFMPDKEPRPLAGVDPS